MYERFDYKLEANFMPQVAEGLRQGAQFRLVLYQIHRTLQRELFGARLLMR